MCVLVDLLGSNYGHEELIENVPKDVVVLDLGEEDHRDGNVESFLLVGPFGFVGMHGGGTVGKLRSDAALSLVLTRFRRLFHFLEPVTARRLYKRYWIAPVPVCHLCEATVRVVLFFFLNDQGGILLLFRKFVLAFNNTVIA